MSEIPGTEARRSAYNVFREANLPISGLFREYRATLEAVTTSVLAPSEQAAAEIFCMTSDARAAVLLSMATDEQAYAAYQSRGLGMAHEEA